MTEKKELKVSNETIFESIKQTNEFGHDFWSARKLSKILGYSEYRHFLPVINKAKEACQNSGQPIHNHFEDVLEMVQIGSGARREIVDVRLSRYACYLIVQNADPAKSIVAIGQTYFAVQTRKQELIEQEEYQSLDSEEEKRLFLRDQMKRHNKQLAGVAKNAGVISRGGF